MKIDSITRQNTLPSGFITVAAIANRHLGKRRLEELNNIPNGKARTRSLFSDVHTVVLVSDARKLGWPIISVASLHV